jgi:hypothetical protein
MDLPSLAHGLYRKKDDIDRNCVKHMVKRM